VFLQTADAPQAHEALRRPLGPINLEQLNLLLALSVLRTTGLNFIPSWSSKMISLTFLAAHENLSQCILKDSEAQRDTLSVQVATELRDLRKLRSQHEGMAQAFQELSIDHQYAKAQLARN